VAIPIVGTRRRKRLLGPRTVVSRSVAWVRRRALVRRPTERTFGRAKGAVGRLCHAILGPDSAQAREWRDRLFRLLDVTLGLDVPHRIHVGFTRALSACSPNYVFRPVQWLDQNESDRVRKLETATSGYSYGPSIDGNQRVAIVRLPAVHLYRFQGGRVHGHSSSVLFADRLVIERTEGCDPRRCAFQTQHVRRHERNVGMVTRTPCEYLQRGIFLGGNGAFNYYHWVIEILPKLRHIEELGAEYQDFPLLVSEDVAHVPTFAEALEVLAPGRPLIFLKTSTTYEVDDLVYISAASGCPFNMRPGHQARVGDFQIRSSTVDFLRQKVGCDISESQEGLRLFLARPSVRRRFNQDEVFELLRRRGFISVSLEDMTWLEQIDLISRAEAIVGASGAAWTNVIFCSRGTKCVSWIPAESDEFASYSTLASFVDADLRYVTYRAGVTSTTEIYTADYRVSVDWIEDTLDGLSISGPAANEMHKPRLDRPQSVG
jgi:capsular polysaccharide biosynthesis protein